MVKDIHRSGGSGKDSGGVTVWSFADPLNKLLSELIPLLKHPRFQTSSNKAVELSIHTADVRMPNKRTLKWLFDVWFGKSKYADHCARLATSHVFATLLQMLLVELEENVKLALNLFERKMQDRGGAMAVSEASYLLGTECFRQHVHPDFWTMVTELKMKNFYSAVNVKAPCIIITDVATLQEAQFVRSLSINNGGKIIQIKRPSTSTTQPNWRSSNDAAVRDEEEAPMDGYGQFYACINNDKTLAKLKETVIEVVGKGLFTGRIG
jgi:hypothetical protein